MALFIENGKRKGENGKLKTERGKRKGERGKGKTENGKRKGERGKQKGERGKEKAESGKRKAESGKRKGLNDIIGWGARVCFLGILYKQYSCPSSKRDEKKQMLFRRELTDIHSKQICYFYFFLSTFCFSSCFHSLVIDFVAATPSPARENFTNVQWIEQQNNIAVPLRRGTAKRYRSFACDDGTFMFPKECRSETKAITQMLFRRELTDIHCKQICYFYFFLSTFCFSSSPCYFLLFFTLILAMPPVDVSLYRLGISWPVSRITSTILS
ncbi:MAG: hypothetical protein E7090_06630 [Bacteroidales bacterium]|nr:hypothetical protein [Bacteroidales bacterium]